MSEADAETEFEAIIYGNQKPIDTFNRHDASPTANHGSGDSMVACDCNAAGEQSFGARPRGSRSDLVKTCTGMRLHSSLIAFVDLQHNRSIY
jgi:hypothetical protein